MGTKREVSENVSLMDGKCPVCGKAFAYYAGMWAYKIQKRGGQTLYFCGWNCMCAYRKANPKTDRRLRGVRMSTPEVLAYREKLYADYKNGMNAKELCKKYHFTLAYVWELIRFEKEKENKNESEL